MHGATGCLLVFERSSPSCRPRWSIAMHLRATLRRTGRHLTLAECQPPGWRADHRGAECPHGAPSSVARRSPGKASCSCTACLPSSYQCTADLVPCARRSGAALAGSDPPCVRVPARPKPTPGSAPLVWSDRARRIAQHSARATLPCRVRHCVKVGRARNDAVSLACASMPIAPPPLTSTPPV